MRKNFHESEDDNASRCYHKKKSFKPDFLASTRADGGNCAKVAGVAAAREIIIHSDEKHTLLEFGGHLILNRNLGRKRLLNRMGWMKRHDWQAPHSC